MARKPPYTRKSDVRLNADLLYEYQQTPIIQIRRLYDTDLPIPLIGQGVNST